MRSMRASSLIILLVVASAAATIYKWVDEKGVTQYTETPPPGKPATKMAEQPLPAPAPRGPGVQELNEEYARSRMQREKAWQDEKAERDAQRVAEGVRRELCLAAQEDLYKLAKAVPLFTLDERGERVYLDDKDRAALLERSMAAVAKYCPPQS